MSKWIFLQKDGYVQSCLIDQGRMLECRLDNREETFVGSIYVARIDNLVSGLKAAFISIGDRTCYYSLTDHSEPLFCKRIRPDKITVGDEILVQIEKDAIKTKDPVARGVLQLSGRYGVVMYPEKGIYFSKKISDETFRSTMKKAFRHKLPEGFGVLFRTNAADAPVEDVQQEIFELAEKLKELTEKAVYRSAGARLWQPETEYLRTLRDLPMHGVEEIVTDCSELYSEISEALKRYPQTQNIPCRLYQDKLLSLEKCYRIPVQLEKALAKQVWLDSGAYLVIEQTEALTAIDVNSGKAAGNKKDMEDFIFRTNLEAAAEIMAQIRLRNLSGIIILDFINMKSKEHEEELLTRLRTLAVSDSVQTTIVDMTALGLVEVTRKKGKDTLERQMKSFEALQ